MKENRREIKYIELARKAIEENRGESAALLLTTLINFQLIESVRIAERRESVKNMNA